jgi:PhoH-like ATPase
MAQKEKTSGNKFYVLDTNVLLHDPKALYAFAGRPVGIPVMVLEEIDSFKKEGTDRGRNARETARILDGLRKQGSLREGVTIDNGSVVSVLFMDTDVVDALPFHVESKDNEILLTALSVARKGSYDVVFISKDLNARIKADALGLKSEDFLSEHVTKDEFYHGWVTVQVPSIELKKDLSPMLLEYAKGYEFSRNEFVLLESQNNPYNAKVFRYMGGGSFKPVVAPSLQWSLAPRNNQQLMAMDLLFDPAVQLISLFGPAGTGKTFLALLAGLHQVLVDDAYRKMLVSRPVIPLGRDIGYLPGTLEEKLHSWMMPVFDNMELITHAVSTARHFDEIENERRRNKKDKRNFGQQSHQKGRSGIGSVEDLVAADKLSLEAITYMRGRSIPYQFILIDEVQNLTPHEVKTLITRVGEGSKIVLAGDPYQIDSPYLDFSSNGLILANERFKGQELFGAVYLETSERSPLSEMASKLL